MPDVSFVLGVIAGIVLVEVAILAGGMIWFEVIPWLKRPVRCGCPVHARKLRRWEEENPYLHPANRNWR